MQLHTAIISTDKIAIIFHGSIYRRPTSAPVMTAWRGTVSEFLALLYVEYFFLSIYQDMRSMLRNSIFLWSFYRIAIAFRENEHSVYWHFEKKFPKSYWNRSRFVDTLVQHGYLSNPSIVYGWHVSLRFLIVTTSCSESDLLYRWVFVHFIVQGRHMATSTAHKKFMNGFACRGFDPYVGIISTSRCQKTPVCKSAK